MLSPASSPTKALIRQAAERLCQAGVISYFQDNLPRNLLIELADGLAAAPVLAVLVPFADLNSLQVISALSERVGEHMVVGASNVSTAEEVSLVVTAGARFVVAPFLRLSAALQALKLDTLYVPCVLSRSEAVDAQAQGFSIQCVYPADILGSDHIRELRAAAPDTRFLAAGGILQREAAAFVQAGVVGVAPELFIKQPPWWSQAEVITQVRAWQSVWSRAQAATADL